jgi:hypothetical protein
LGFAFGLHCEISADGAGKDSTMSRRPALFTQADITRAAKAAQKVGLVVEVRADGVIRIVPEKREQEPAALVEAPPQPLI